MQFAEKLTSGRQAADAVRARLDWKYALSLDLEDSGFDPRRALRVQGTAPRRRRGGTALEPDAPRALQGEEAHPRRAAGSAPTLAHILAAVRELNRPQVSSGRPCSLERRCSLRPDAGRFRMASVGSACRVVRACAAAGLPVFAYRAAEPSARRWPTPSAKTHLQHVATAAAITLKRALSWLSETPRSWAFRSPLSQLALLSARRGGLRPFANNIQMDTTPG